VKKIHVFTQIRVHFFKTHSFKCQNHTFIPYEFLIFKTAFLKLYIYIYIYIYIYYVLKSSLLLLYIFNFLQTPRLGLVEGEVLCNEQ
jgi:hypothetical protein